MQDLIFLNNLEYMYIKRQTCFNELKTELLQTGSIKHLLTENIDLFFILTVCQQKHL